MIKKLLIGILVLAAVAVSSHAQQTKTFKYVERYGNGVMLDEDIIGDANRTGVAMGRKAIAMIRRNVAAGDIAHSFIRCKPSLHWLQSESERRYGNNTTVARTWADTAWRACVITLDDPAFLNWYARLPQHENQQPIIAAIQEAAVDDEN